MESFPGIFPDCPSYLSVESGQGSLRFGFRLQLHEGGSWQKEACCAADNFPNSSFDLTITIVGYRKIIADLGEVSKRGEGGFWSGP